MKLGKAIPYNITIEPSDNQGFRVNIGCGHFVFSDATLLQEGLDEYFEDPKKWEAEYNKIPRNAEPEAVRSQEALPERATATVERAPTRTGSAERVT